MKQCNLRPQSTAHSSQITANDIPQRELTAVNAEAGIKHERDADDIPQYGRPYKVSKKCDERIIVDLTDE